MDNGRDFLERYRGYCRNLLEWADLDGLWQRLHESDEPWYVYAIGEEPPSRPLDGEALRRFITEVDALLRKEHDESYCGIVYVDNPQAPSLVKIYDPNNLGSVCGPGFGPPPLPGWVLSILPPVDLRAAFPLPENRRRWWRRLFNR